MALSQELYHVYFYVPPLHADHVKDAMFAAGAGRIGLYDSCAWESPGAGQFRPLEGSNPFLGKSGELSREPELKIEMVCASADLETVLAALKTAHPYEEPAYGAYPIWTISIH